MTNTTCADAFTGHIIKLDNGRLYFRLLLDYIPEPVWFRHYRDGRNIAPLNHGPAVEQLERLWQAQRDTTPTQQEMRLTNE